MSDELIPGHISAYCEQYSDKESALLALINTETHAEVGSPRMLSGHLQGRFLAMIAQMMQPKRILEIGTYTGYSALCMAEGLPDDGRLYTIDKDLRQENRVKNYFSQSSLGHKITYLLGDARELIAGIDEVWDLVFIDADKSGYALYYDLVIEKMRPGGMVVADNVLWKGKVAGNESDFDKQARHMHEFNLKINNDQRVSNLLLPVRDGLMLITKK